MSLLKKNTAGGLPKTPAFQKFALLGFFFCLLLPARAEARSFEDIFPELGTELKARVFAEGGVIRALEKNGKLQLFPAAASGIDLHSRMTQKGYGYLVESLLVIPYAGKTLNILDTYNALGKVRNLKGRLYHSATRDADIPLFEDATRLEGAKRTGAIPDPPPAASVPASETIYIKLKDVNFGNSYYKADIAPQGRGIVYSLSNFKSLTYLLFPVMKEDKFSAYLYLEPLDEGVLVYSIAGADVSDFIASKIDIPSAISKRLAVFLDWINDGIRETR
jgi:hypothetical protein